MKATAKLSRRLLYILNSSWYFRAIVAVFCGEALWIALTGNYPMAFDENFHFGLIQIYAHHLSPYLASQPAHADAYGAVARDPSYLYQYLMSFPYRFIELFTKDQTIQVIILRLLNIGLFAAGLPLYRRLLARAGALPALINLCFTVFILLPVVPLLAAQINYDNLLLPLVALTMLLTLELADELTRSKQMNLVKTAVLLSLCLLTSLVKYAFLPIFAAIAVFLVWRLVIVYRRHDGALRIALSSGWRRLSLLSATSLLLMVVVSGGLFFQRYGINLIRYHEIIPDCSQVLTVQQCSAYGPWDRDYTLALTKPAHADANPLAFTADWLYGMWLRMFFAVDGPNSNFQTRGPLFLPSVAAIAAAFAGVVCLAIYGRRLWQRLDHAMLVLIVVTGSVYVITLWLDEYKSFVSTGQPVAINGRYLLPVMLPGIFLLALAYREFFRHRPAFRTLTVYAVLLCFICGGGALTYILRSNDAWYWPNPVVKKANHVVQKIAGPVTPGNSHPTAFLK